MISELGAYLPVEHSGVDLVDHYSVTVMDEPVVLIANDHCTKNVLGNTSRVLAFILYSAQLSNEPRPEVRS
jgi:hypothetical protein